jgi:hypothetical protein
MWDFSISKTLAIMLKTMPFIIIRMAVYFTITAAYILSTGAGAGIGFGIGNIFSDPEGQASFAFWGGLFGFGAVSLAIFWIREYILYIVKAGHIAVMVRLIDGHEIPNGQSQLSYGKDIVSARFAEANILFGIDQILKGVIRMITGLVGGIGMILPIPGVQGLLGFFKTIIRLSLTYIDEVILGYNMRIDSKNPYETAQDGLVLYAQNAKALIKNAIWLSIFLWVVTFFVFLLMLAPASAVLYFFPGQLAGWSFVLAIVFAWALKTALLEPFAIAALMTVYFKEIDGQIPDPEWRAKLSLVSNKFAELKDKAANYANVSFGGRQ